MIVRALAFASVLAAGCLDARDVRLPEDVDQVKTETFEIPEFSPPPLDILIVVDNSAQMAAFEDNVVANLPAFGALFERNAGWWDRHIGVVTADVGCPNRPAWRPAQLTNGSFFIDWRHLDDTRTKNFEGTLDDHLPAAMAAGHDGCGEHRPLDAIVAALDPTARFRRSEADLIIVILAASDDRSEISVDEALRAVSETCVPALNSKMRTMAFAPADSPRLAAFVATDLFGQVAPIDATDMMPFFETGFSRNGWWGGSGAHCFNSMHLDTDRAEGFQPRCTVSDVVRDPTTREVIYEDVLPVCNGSNRPCWRAEARPNLCSQDPRYGIEIERFDFPPFGTVLTGQCEIVETP